VQRKMKIRTFKKR